MSLELVFRHSSSFLCGEKWLEIYFDCDLSSVVQHDEAGSEVVEDSVRSRFPRTLQTASPPPIFVSHHLISFIEEDTMKETAQDLDDRRPVREALSDMFLNADVTFPCKRRLKS